jgi:hypothetical protein
MPVYQFRKDAIEEQAMTKNERYPSYAACVTNVLSSSQHPISVDALLAQIAGQRPLGKGARSAVYRAINQIFQAVPVAPGRYGWLSHLLNGAVFRHPLTADEIRRGYVLIDELEHIVFFPQFFQSSRPDNRILKIELFGGPVIQAEATIERKTWSLRLGPEFTAWVNELGGQGKDDMLIFVKDTSAGEYQVRLNLREMRDERLIRQRNVQLALAAEEMVSDNRRAAMATWDLAARLIGRGLFHELPPADDFHFVLHEYSLLRFRDGVGYVLLQGDDQIIESGPNRENQTDETTDITFDTSGTLRRIVFTIHEDRDDNVNRRSGGQQHFQDPFDIDQETLPMSDDSPFGPEESCVDYQAYLEALHQDQPGATALSHEEFHLLEAELEMLVRLEEEFGHLLREQQERKDYLAATLYIDPSEFLADDWDANGGGPDAYGPPFWAN